jgi:alkylhydroperoxidase family enzyme
MARLNIPQGEGTEFDRVWSTNPGIGDVYVALRTADYTQTHLSLRLHEAVRFLIANCNECGPCMGARLDRGVERQDAGLPESFYTAVLEDRNSDEFDERERLALEYTHRFIYDHFSITDELFDDLKRVFTDVELFDLCVTVARMLGFGRMTAVTELLVACEVQPLAGATG